ncbi:MAG TPA: hypothetical protein VLD86_02010, partial [Ilumatobacteraceae bacterium]|nr:hypothetical protein [Ilumatobacteraceae bacterium]
LERIGVDMSDAQIAEARALIDPVVDGLGIAGRPLAAANASLALPDDPLTSLWQQVTVLREWRGDVHVAVLVANELGPSDCLVLQVGTGRFPLRFARATRKWTDEEWSAAQQRLAAKGWMNADGTMTEAGIDAREQLEAETDRLCEAIWQPIGDEGARRLGELISPIHAAVNAAGTYAALA